MTNDDKALVERLRGLDAYGYQSQLACEAANHIERLEALFTNATYEAKAMMEEINRLRRALNNIRALAAKRQAEGGPDETLAYVEGFARAALGESHD